MTVATQSAGRGTPSPQIGAGPGLSLSLFIDIEQVTAGAFVRLSAKDSPKPVQTERPQPVSDRPSTSRLPVGQPGPGSEHRKSRQRITAG